MGQTALIPDGWKQLRLSVGREPRWASGLVRVQHYGLEHPIPKSRRDVYRHAHRYPFAYAADSLVARKAEEADGKFDTGGLPSLRDGMFVGAAM